MKTPDTLTAIPAEMTSAAIDALDDAAAAWADVGQIAIEDERQVPTDLALGVAQLVMAREIVARAARSFARLQVAR